MQSEGDAWRTDQAVSPHRGVDSPAAYRAAQQLGVDVVMTDSPVRMKAMRAAVK